MRRPRWRKVLRDLWNNKTRTILVVLSIAVGVFAVGTIASVRVILLRDMSNSILASQPASVTFTTDPFDAELVQTARHISGVGMAEGRATLNVRVEVGPNEWKSLLLNVIADYSDMRINKVLPIVGRWPPPRKEVLIERGSLDYLGAQFGSTILIEMPDGTRRPMRVAGLAHDVSVPNARLAPFAFGYVTLDTLEWLGQPRNFTRLDIIVAEDAQNEAHVKQIANQIRDKIEKGGRTIYSMTIYKPGKHWAEDIIQALLLILAVLGILSVLLSGFIVLNTVGALLAQQTRQIAIMKAIGARRRQIAGLYFTMALIYGLLAIGCAVPLAAVAASQSVRLIAGLLNIDSGNSALLPQVLLIEIAAGLVVPILAAIWPILRSTRITVREAISSQGLGSDRFGASRVDRMFGRMRGPSRPLLLSLRNTFRRRGRLTLTLSTLALGGAMLIAVFSVRESLVRTLDDLYGTYNYDFMVFMDRDSRIEPMEAQALRVPGVVGVESWGRLFGRRLQTNGTKSDTITILAPRAQTKLFHAKIVAGRWLLPEDRNAIVVASDLLKDEADLKVGDTLMLDINGQMTSWHIVGVAQVLFAQRTVYTNYEDATRTANDVGRSSLMVVVTDRHDVAYQSEVAKNLQDRFKQAGLRVRLTYTIGQDRNNAEFQFSILITFLLIMSVLLGLVGGLGLMGTMSLNVLERTREIGVMRVIGASNGALLRIVILEGVLVGVLSWLLGALLALPMSMLLSQAVGVSMLKAPLSYGYSIRGAVLWLGGVIVLGTIASFLPAWNASRLSVGDVLAYE
jgi:putative ABC transport system permease protein